MTESMIGSSNLGPCRPYPSAAKLRYAYIMMSPVTCRVFNSRSSLSSPVGPTPGINIRHVEGAVCRYLTTGSPWLVPGHFLRQPYDQSTGLVGQASTTDLLPRRKYELLSELLLCPLLSQYNTPLCNPCITRFRSLELRPRKASIKINLGSVSGVYMFWGPYWGLYWGPPIYGRIDALS